MINILIKLAKRKRCAETKIDFVDYWIASVQKSTSTMTIYMYIQGNKVDFGLYLWITLHNFAIEFSYKWHTAMVVWLHSWLPEFCTNCVIIKLFITLEVMV